MMLVAKAFAYAWNLRRVPRIGTITVNRWVEGGFLPGKRTIWRYRQRRLCRAFVVATYMIDSIWLTEMVPPPLYAEQGMYREILSRLKGKRTSDELARDLQAVGARISPNYLRGMMCGKQLVNEDVALAVMRLMIGR